MIIVQSPPGLIGYHMLHTLLRYWAVPFDTQFEIDPDRDHHRPDLFLPDWNAISADQLIDLSSLTDRPSLVFVSNHAVVPDLIASRVSSDKIFTVQLDSVEREIQVAFGHCLTDRFNQFDYDVPNQDPEAYHQRLWNQLCERLSINFPPARGRLLRYENAESESDFSTFLDEIANEFDLDPPDNNLQPVSRPTMANVMSKATAHHIEFASRYVVFRDICQQILDGGADPAQTWQAATSDTKSQFEILMAFFHSRRIVWDWQSRNAPA